MPTPKTPKNNAPEEIQNSETKKPGPKINSRVKPIVEGINSPKTTSDILVVKQASSPNPQNFTEQERKLISETDKIQEPIQKPKIRLMPESVVNRQSAKQTHYKAIFIITILLLALIYAGYKLYAWELQKNSVQSVQNTPPASAGDGNLLNPATSTPEDINASTTSSTLGSIPFPLAGGTAPTSTLATSSPTHATSTAPVLELKINSTPTGYLNVRSAPSSSGKIIGQVHPGEIYTYTATKPGWYFINIPELDSGWISAQYATPQ